jgi:uncharacterized protein (TIGR03435 family)
VAQPAPAFEVASIRASSDGPGSSGITTTNGRMTAQNVTLKRCIRGAYNVSKSQIFGGPDWVERDRFYIQAKAPGPAGDSEMMIMLQSLLAERFKLTLHRENRPLSGYALVLAKGGPKLKPSAPETPSRTNSSRGSIVAQACTMTLFAMKLSEALLIPVADATAIRGSFDFNLQWTTADEMAAKPETDSGPSIFTTLQEQLGLKLEPRKVPAEILVIDHAEKPSAN